MSVSEQIVDGCSVVGRLREGSEEVEELDVIGGEKGEVVVHELKCGMINFRYQP
jgi:hypothetical protein